MLFAFDTIRPIALDPTKVELSTNMLLAVCIEIDQAILPHTDVFVTEE